MLLIHDQPSNKSQAWPTTIGPHPIPIKLLNKAASSMEILNSAGFLALTTT